MFGEERRPVAVEQDAQAAEMVRVERPVGADREADPVDRQRIAGADGGQVPVRRPAGTHVVLGMDLEEADVGLRVENLVVVLGLEADARPGGQRSQVVVWE